MSRTRTPVIAVALAAVVAYAGTLVYGFVLDDRILVLQSYHLHQWRTLPALLTQQFMANGGEVVHYYRPFITLTLFADLMVWSTNPFGFHLTNVLAHLLTSLAVLALGRRLTGNDTAALIGGLLFALHPIHTESVAFISGRTDVFATLFSVAAVLAYAAWRESGRLLLYVASLLAFLLALLSKEVAVVVPALLVLYDWCCRGDLRSRSAVARALIRYAPLGLVLAVYGAARLVALGRLADSDPVTWADGRGRTIAALRIAAEYMWATLMPYPIHTFYQVKSYTEMTGVTAWLGLALLAALLAATALAMWRQPRLGFGLVWFWVSIVPPIGANLLPVAKAYMAERFLYMPSVGICLVGGMLLARALGRIEPGRAARIRPVPAAGLALLLVASTVLVQLRNEDWKDELRLYTSMVDSAPESWLPRLNLGFEYLRRGMAPAAVAELRKAHELSPGRAKVKASLGLAEASVGNVDAARVLAIESYRIDPRDPSVVSMRADVHAFRGELEEVGQYLRETLALNPHQVAALFNLSAVLQKLGRQIEADATLGRALELDRIMNTDHFSANRVIAEVRGQRDPAQAREAWERHIARLRDLAEPNPMQLADLANARERLAELKTGAL